MILIRSIIRFTTFVTVNVNREHFDMGFSDLTHADVECPRWLDDLLTSTTRELSNYKGLIEKLNCVTRYKPFSRLR